MDGVGVVHEEGSMKWLKALGQAALTGGLLVVAPFAASMASDGYTWDEGRTLLAQFISGAIGGMVGMFTRAPRSTDSRDRADD